MGRAAGNRDAWWGLEKNRQAAQVDAAAHEREEYIPFEPAIVADTDEFLVVDKPPFLPATPNGRIGPIPCRSDCDVVSGNRR